MTVNNTNGLQHTSPASSSLAAAAALAAAVAAALPTAAPAGALLPATDDTALRIAPRPPDLAAAAGQQNTRVRYTRLTQSHLVDHADSPKCRHCHQLLSVTHILIACTSYSQLHNQHFSLRTDLLKHSGFKKF